MDSDDISHAKDHAGIAPGIIVLLGTLYISFNLGAFVFFNSSLTRWLLSGLTLGLILAGTTGYEIRTHGSIRAANASIFLAIIAAGALFGGGLISSLWANHLWSASPPGSFALIQPPNDIGLNVFFVVFNGLLEVLVILALVLNWRVPQRRSLLIIAGAVFLAMRVWTSVYFIPNIKDFYAAVPTEPFSTELKKRADEWVYLSYYRTAIDGVAQMLFAIAAFVPFSPRSSNRVLRSS